MGKATREEVYHAIDTERAYQQAQRGNSKPHDEHRDRPLSTGECLYCIEELLDQARKAWYRPDGRDDALGIVRKIAGVAVQCMENHGAFARE